MIVGADAADNPAILATTDNLYGNSRLRRVYYSAFSPIPDASAKLPLLSPPLQRENRLYQTDWLLRFYGFGVDEIAPAEPAACLIWTSTRNWHGRCETPLRSRSISIPRRAKCCCACPAGDADAREAAYTGFVEDLRLLPGAIGNAGGLLRLAE